MIGREVCLIEIHTEELPAKILLKLAAAFKAAVSERLQRAGLDYGELDDYITPRRLALIINGLTEKQRDQKILRKGPALSSAYDAQHQLTAAGLGFARSLGITNAQLISIQNEQGSWVGYEQVVPGKTVHELLPPLINDALLNCANFKKMRWGKGDVAFIRPVHAVILLYGDQIIPGSILGCKIGRATRGHRYHTNGWLTINHASDYVRRLQDHYVIADFARRRAEIVQLMRVALAKFNLHADLLLNDELLDEVTGIVEWPCALVGEFNPRYLKLPFEVLQVVLQDQQRYFPLQESDSDLTKINLLPYFILISNIDSQEPKRLIDGNQRVLQARLADAEFFYQTDQKQSLTERVLNLAAITYHAKLGSVYDKIQRLDSLVQYLSSELGLDSVSQDQLKQATKLCKADLTTNLVKEFPQLQGIMGGYYALHDGLADEIAIIISDHYHPRFAGDVLPRTQLGCVLALADKIDNIVSVFGINQHPSGDKDPYGLRRGAIGVIRLINEQKFDLDLLKLNEFALALHINSLENKNAAVEAWQFIFERLRNWYSDEKIDQDVVNAVCALALPNLRALHMRILALQQFKAHAQVGALCQVNKRVNNILAQFDTLAQNNLIDPKLFCDDAERELAATNEQLVKITDLLVREQKFTELFLQLLKLQLPIDNFFTKVMVMVDDDKLRANRLALLSQAHNLLRLGGDLTQLKLMDDNG